MDLSKADLTELFISKGLTRVPTNVLTVDDSSLRGTIDKYLAEFGSIVMRSSSAKNRLNLPFLITRSWQPIPRFLQSLPHTVDKVIVQAYESIELSFEYLQTPELSYVEIAPGTRIQGESGNVYGALIRKASQNRLGFVARQTGIEWKNATGRVANLDGERAFLASSGESPPLGEVINFATTACTSIRAVLNTDIFHLYAHKSSEFGWSTQNMRLLSPEWICEVTRQMSFKIPVKSEITYKDVMSPQDVNPVLEGVNLRLIGTNRTRSSEEVVNIFQRMIALGHKHVSIPAGVLSHEAILARELGLNVVI